MGGIAEHAHYQARAFSKSSNPSVEVVVLCSPDFLNGRKVDYGKIPVFGFQFSVSSRVVGRIGALLDRSLKLIGDQWRLAWEVMKRRPNAVLLASYSEYLSPFWVWPHWVLSKCFGVVYVANLHDPVRDYVVGPKWWHDLSVRMAYWPIRVGVVHQKLPKPSPVPKHVHVVEAPVGVYDLQELVVDPLAIRAGWGVGGRVAPEDRRSAPEELDHEPHEPHEPHEGFEPRMTRMGTDMEEEAGLRFASQAGAAFPNPSTSELARDSENTSLTRSASSPASAAALDSASLADGGHSRSEWSGDFEGPSSSSLGSGPSKTLPARASGVPTSASSSVPMSFDSFAPAHLAPAGLPSAVSRAAAQPPGCGLNSGETKQVPCSVTAPKAQALDSGRSSLDASAPADVVFLAFGFIRDNKNLDLVIRALVENPKAFLVVMGKAQSQKDKPVEFYRNLAEELGVAERVRFFDEFVPDEKLAGYFSAADVVVLTYDKTFHSQSGVLNVAARARRPVLASAGESPLKECVESFNLGVFVEPDDLDALKKGMKMVARGERLEASQEPDWEGYEKFASWDVNVEKILEAIRRCL
jgi:glycosyltransferase involved in cell wall biosynthesis